MAYEQQPPVNNARYFFKSEDCRSTLVWLYRHICNKYSQTQLWQTARDRSFLLVRTLVRYILVNLCTQMTNLTSKTVCYNRVFVNNRVSLHILFYTFIWYYYTFYYSYFSKKSNYLIKRGKTVLKNSFLSQT